MSLIVSGSGRRGGGRGAPRRGVWMSTVEGWPTADLALTRTQTVTVPVATVDPSLILAAPTNPHIGYDGAQTFSDVAVTYAGTTYPVTVAGEASWTIPRDSAVETDRLPLGGLPAGASLAYSAYVTRATTYAAGRGTPYGIVGHSTKPSLLVCGDSNNSQDFSAVPLALRDAGVPYSNISLSGQTFPYFSDAIVRGKGGWVGRHTHLLSVCGVNSQVPLAQFQADALAMYARIAPYVDRIVQCTVTPRTTSTDSWVTVGGQTIASPNQIDYNPWLRDGMPLDPDTRQGVPTGTVGALRVGADGHPVWQVLDVCSVCEPYPDAFVWPAAGAGNPYTGDGTHYSGVATNAVRAYVRGWAETLTI